MSSYKKLEEDGAPNSPKSTEEEKEQVEVNLDLSSLAPSVAEEELKVINVSVTNGGSIMATFEYTFKDEEMAVADFKSDLESRLTKLDQDRKLRMLIYRGQILQNGKKICDYKFNHGDTLQLLTWVPEAVAAATPAPQAAPPYEGMNGASPRSILSRADFGGFEEQRAFPTFHHTAHTVHGSFQQDEVERWAARVKVWTCMLMLIYSFKLLVGMSQSLEAHHRQQSSDLAISFLGFWVAYIGLRAATRLNHSLARGYYYGQMTVAMCSLFLVAIRDPSMNGSSARATNPNVIYVAFAINIVFWAYIVYGAYRFQRALWQWLQDGAPDHILEAQEDV